MNSFLNLFSDNSELDHISVSALEAMIVSYPFAGIYKLMLAIKMNQGISHDLSMQMNDTSLLHYRLIHNERIPNISHQNDFLNSSETNSEKDAEESNSSLYTDFTAEESISIAPINNFEIDQDQNQTILKSNDLEQKSQLSAVLQPDENILNTQIVLENKNDSSKEVAKSRKNKIKAKKFKLKEFSGISDFSKWLLSFKKEDIESKILKEEKAAKKRAIEENAKKSVTKLNSIISEPLAEILALQGHLDDSKKMYQQLMIKYPEKSSYFAQKLNNL